MPEIPNKTMLNKVKNAALLSLHCDCYSLFVEHSTFFSTIFLC